MKILESLPANSVMQLCRPDPILSTPFFLPFFLTPFFLNYAGLTPFFLGRRNKNPATWRGSKPNKYQVADSAAFVLFWDCRITSLVSPAIQGPSACQ
jgi:hypothetical protein